MKGTYNLEGDGLMVFTCTCYEEVNVINNAIHFENISNVRVRVLGNSLSHSPAVRQQLLSYAINCVTPGLEYFQRQLHVQSSLKAPLEAFKAARLFSPHKLSLPNWAAAAKKVLVVQPLSSAAAERVFTKSALGANWTVH